MSAREAEWDADPRTMDTRDAVSAQVCPQTGQLAVSWKRNARRVSLLNCLDCSKTGQRAAKFRAGKRARIIGNKKPGGAGLELSVARAVIAQRSKTVESTSRRPSRDARRGLAAGSRTGKSP